MPQSRLSTSHRAPRPLSAYLTPQRASQRLSLQRPQHISLPLSVSEVRLTALQRPQLISLLLGASQYIPQSLSAPFSAPPSLTAPPANLTAFQRLSVHPTEPLSASQCPSQPYSAPSTFHCSSAPISIPHRPQSLSAPHSLTAPQHISHCSSAPPNASQCISQPLSASLHTSDYYGPNVKPHGK